MVDETPAPPDDAELRADLKTVNKGIFSRSRIARDLVARLDTPDGLARLIDSLNDADPEVQSGALNILEQMKRLGEPGVAEAAIRILDDEKSPARSRAVQVLGLIASPAALSALQQMRDHPSIGLRITALYGLAQHGDSNALDTLRGMLDDPDRNARRRAIDTLGDLNDTGAGDHLLECLRDPDLDIRLTAMKALVRIGHPRLAEALTDLMADPEKRARKEAIKALDRLHDPALVDLFLKVLANDPESRIRGKAVYALSHIPDERAVHAHLAALHDSDATVRIWAVQSAPFAGDAEGPRFIEPLMNLLKNDPDDFVRETAAAHLSYLKAGEAVEPLIAALADESLHVRLAVVEALGRLKDGRAVEPLAALFEDASDPKYIRYYTRIDAIPPGIGFDAPIETWARLEIVHSLERIDTPESKMAAADLSARLNLDPRYSGKHR